MSIDQFDSMGKDCFLAWMLVHGEEPIPGGQVLRGLDFYVYRTCTLDMR